MFSDRIHKHFCQGCMVFVYRNIRNCLSNIRSTIFGFRCSSKPVPGFVQQPCFPIGYTSTSARDVWYSFTGISGTAYRISVAPSSGLDAVVNLFQGSCSSHVFRSDTQALLPGMYGIRLPEYPELPIEYP